MYVSGKYFVVKYLETNHLEKGQTKIVNVMLKHLKNTLEYTKVIKLVLISFWQANRFNFYSLRPVGPFHGPLWRHNLSLVKTLYLNFNMFYIYKTTRVC